jgi:transcriptional regulator with AAA-type ATPase domain
VLVHADHLSEPLARAVVDLLTDGFTDTATETRPRLALTVEPHSSDTPVRAVFSRTIEVPRLRHHIDDIPELVRHLLVQLTGHERLVFSPQALAQLSRPHWPGNVRQLHKVLGELVKHRHAGTIELADLPPECRSTSRRVLSPIEALERDAIVKALSDSGESPTAAAQMLGMSRATIYRKIRQYSIVSPCSASRRKDRYRATGSGSSSA